MQLQLYGNKIWLFNSFIDFRASIDGRVALISTQLKQNPQAGIYLFFNKRKDKIKCLSWHKNGFVLIYKRLEKGKFDFEPSKTAGTLAIKLEELSWSPATLEQAQKGMLFQQRMEQYLQEMEKGFAATADAVLCSPPMAMITYNKHLEAAGLIAKLDKSPLDLDTPWKEALGILQKFRAPLRSYVQTLPFDKQQAFEKANDVVFKFFTEKRKLVLTAAKPK